MPKRDGINPELTAEELDQLVGGTQKGVANVENKLTEERKFAEGTYGSRDAFKGQEEASKVAKT